MLASREQNKTSDITIQIEQFRAIHSANIGLNGITVVSGINGCGKSTISKLLYYSIRYNKEFEQLVFKKAFSKISSIKRILDKIYRRLPIEGLNESFLLARKKSSSSSSEKYTIESLKFSCEKVADLVEMLIGNVSQIYSDGHSSVRFKALLIERMSRFILTEDEEMTLEDFVYYLKSLIEKTDNILPETEELLKKRKTSFFSNLFETIFNQDVLPHITVSEYDHLLYSPNKESVNKFETISNIAYIDTPMAIGIEEDYDLPEHWLSINRLLKSKKKETIQGSLFEGLEDYGVESDNKSLNQIISDEIIKGDVEYKEDSLFDDSGFYFNRKDGKSFELTECATGIRSFSLLQSLLKNNFFDSESLLIIDEPEAHLHPQWIIEYARLIVLINKKLGAKFFVTSHSTDMVSALKYICEKEKTTSRLSFYLAKESEEENLYDYESLGVDIEPIFESFNKSYDKLDLYGDEESCDE